MAAKMEKKKKRKSERYFTSEEGKDPPPQCQAQDEVEVFTPDLSEVSRLHEKDYEQYDLSTINGGKQKKPKPFGPANATERAARRSTTKSLPQTTSASTSVKMQIHDLSEMDLSNFKTSKAALKKAFASHKQDEKRGKKKANKWSERKKDMREGRTPNFSHMREDPFPGDLPISKEKMETYQRGDQMDLENLRTRFHQTKFKSSEQTLLYAVKQAARTELLMEEEAGYLEADEGEHTSEVTQHDLARAVDILSAQKFFELKLDKFGPYKMNYTRNGRFLLIGGRKGHIAAMDWQTKRLMCETNVMETCQDMKWLHIETMFAAAQKKWTYIYDNQGVELHCLKVLDRVLRLEFLPYHFLLASANEVGYLSYLDVSVGQKVAGFTTGLGRLDVMCQNPSNAIIHLGHSGGTVTLWSPNVKEPLVKMLCHGSGTRSLAVDRTGKYMATSGMDRTLKIWDLRTYKALQSYKIAAGASHLTFSDRSLLAAGIGNIVEVYKDCCTEATTAPYMTHRLTSSVHSLQFCPYEDVLGVGHGDGFTSLLVPGAGQANYDALEANPYQSKKQRQEAEVKMLLEKIQPEMINLSTSVLGQVDKETVEQKMEERAKLLYLKPMEKLNFEPKYKKKGKSKAGKFEQRKKGVESEHKRKQIREAVQQKQLQQRERQQSEKRTGNVYNVFDRFKRRDT